SCSGGSANLSLLLGLVCDDGTMALADHLPAARQSSSGLGHYVLDLAQAKDNLSHVDASKGSDEPFRCDGKIVGEGVDPGIAGLYLKAGIYNATGESVTYLDEVALVSKEAWAPARWLTAFDFGGECTADSPNCSPLELDPRGCRDHRPIPVNVTDVYPVSASEEGSNPAGWLHAWGLTWEEGVTWEEGSGWEGEVSCGVTGDCATCSTSADCSDENCVGGLPKGCRLEAQCVANQCRRLASRLTSYKGSPPSPWLVNALEADHVSLVALSQVAGSWNDPFSFKISAACQSDQTEYVAIFVLQDSGDLHEGLYGAGRFAHLDPYWRGEMPLDERGIHVSVSAEDEEPADGFHPVPRPWTDKSWHEHFLNLEPAPTTDLYDFHLGHRRRVVAVPFSLPAGCDEAEVTFELRPGTAFPLAAMMIFESASDDAADYVDLVEAFLAFQRPGAAHTMDEEPAGTVTGQALTIHAAAVGDIPRRDGPPLGDQLDTNNGLSTVLVKGRERTVTWQDPDVQAVVHTVGDESDSTVVAFDLAAHVAVEELEVGFTPLVHCQTATCGGCPGACPVDIPPCEGVEEVAADGACVAETQPVLHGLRNSVVSPNYRLVTGAPLELEPAVVMPWLLAPPKPRTLDALLQDLADGSNQGDVAPAVPWTPDYFRRLREGQTRQLRLRWTPSRDQTPGTYTTKVQVKIGEQQVAEFPVTFHVLPMA
ncbi:MAG: hypothetical protein QF464_11075, partial [Myxococcota bacterium]|nr:hypothetical protein [Myxococcota bacterium]